MTISKLLLPIILVFISTNNVFAEDIPFPLDKACIAWKTNKTMFLFKRQSPVGINCKVDISITPDETGKTYSISLEAPIKSFDSGDEHRDKDVFEILGGQKQANILVSTSAYSKKDWLDIFDGGQADAIMQLGGNKFNLTIPFETNNDVLTGVMKTKFSDFNIKAPKVVFGLVANVSENLDLAFSIPKTEIKGIAPLYPNNKAGN